MRLRHVVSAMATVLAGILLVPATASGASAQTVEDPTGDGRYGVYGDIQSLSVTKVRGGARVRTTFREYADLHYFMVKRAGSTKPSRVVTWETEYAETPEDLSRITVQTWKDFTSGSGENVCALESGRFWGGPQLAYAFRLPLTCLGVGKRASRLQVRETTYQLAADFDGPSDATRFTRSVALKRR